MSTEKHDRWSRVTGTDREALKKRVASMYLDDEKSIREIGSEVGRSYGAVHNLLTEAKVPLRPRGSSHG